MKIEILYSDRFKKDIKRLFKKNRKIRADIDTLINTLKSNPNSGTPLGNECYKIRLKDSSTTRRKSGGYRVITYFIEENFKIILLTIYSKSNKSNISDNEIKTILSALKE